MYIERRVKSFDAFSEKLHEQSPQLVVIQADRRPARGLFRTSFTAAVGELGDFSHGLLYSVQKASKQRGYIEPLFTSFQSTYGFGDHIERNKRIMAVLLAGEIRRDQLSVLLPETEIYLAGSDQSKPMSEEDLDRLHEQSHE